MDATTAPAFEDLLARRVVRKTLVEFTEALAHLVAVVLARRGSCNVRDAWLAADPDDRHAFARVFSGELALEMRSGGSMDDDCLRHHRLGLDVLACFPDEVRDRVVRKAFCAFSLVAFIEQDLDDDGLLAEAGESVLFFPTVQQVLDLSGVCAESELAFSLHFTPQHLCALEVFAALANVTLCGRRDCQHCGLHREGCSCRDCLDRASRARIRSLVPARPERPEARAWKRSRRDL